MKLLTAAIVLVAGLLTACTASPAPSQPAASQPPKPTVTVYRSPT